MRLTARVLDPGGIAGAGTSGELLGIASLDARRAVQVVWALAVAVAARRQRVQEGERTQARWK